jgi:hypothetical protein
MPASVDQVIRVPSMSKHVALQRFTLDARQASHFRRKSSHAVANPRISQRRYTTPRHRPIVNEAAAPATVGAASPCC